MQCRPSHTPHDKQAILRGAFVIVLLACCIVAFIFDPKNTPWLPKCTLYQWTGLYCPGCGNTRALHALMHGHLLESLDYNVLLIPYGFCLWLFTWYPQASSKRVIVWIIVTVVTFTLLRNLPWYPFTILAP